jgi:hypothetical protein
LCGFDVVTTCAEYRSNNVPPGGDTNNELIYSIILNEGYHFIDNLTIPLFKSNLFTIKSAGIGLIRTKTAPYADILWGLNDTIAAYCDSCQVPFMNLQTYARFGVDYSRSTGPNNLVYSFGTNYDNTGSYTIDARFFAITPLLKDTELITISNRYYYDR